MHTIKLNKMCSSNIYAKYFPSFFWLLFALAFSLSTHAQSNPIFEAYCDAKEVFLNGYFEIKFTLKNANGADFSAPNFENFTISAGPNRSESVQIINGQVSREVGYSFTLKANKVGTFSIGSASINANNKILKSLPVSIKVLPQSQATEKEKESTGQAYVQIEPNKIEAYPGEQILLDYKLYTTVSLEGYDITEEPDYKGFYVQELRRFNSGSLREIVNGKQMTTKVLRRLALFPQQTGPLTIPSAQIQLAMVEDNGRTGFFFSRNIKPLFIATEPVNILIKEIPRPFPKDFTGAVGQFKFQASIEHRQITTDDAVSILVMISGNGDIKRVQPPPLMLSDSFDLYPPKIIEENITEENGTVLGRKIIEYLALPKHQGNYLLHPTFSYFNTESAAFETVKAGPFPLFVKKGSDKHQAQSNIQRDNEISGDIKPIKLESKLSKKGLFFVDSFTFIIFMGFPLLAFMGLLIFKKSKIKNQNQLNFKQADKIALQRLSTAKNHLLSSATRAFYDEISKASLGYICDKMNIPLSELSKDNMREKLVSTNISPAQIEEFMRIIQTCETALFAGMDNSSDMQVTYDNAIRLISGIEEEIEAKNHESK